MNYLQRVVVELDLREVLPRLAVARVVEGADEALREVEQPGGRHRLFVEEVINMTLITYYTNYLN